MLRSAHTCSDKHARVENRELVEVFPSIFIVHTINMHVDSISSDVLAPFHSCVFRSLVDNALTEIDSLNVFNDMVVLKRL